MSKPTGKNPLQDIATLHEEAVKAIARGEVTERSFKSRRLAAVADHPTYTGVVDQAVMEAVKSIIDNGTYTRWIAFGPREVLVV